MSQQNVEIAVRLFERFSRGDYSDASAFDPDIEFVTMPDQLDPGSYRGLAEMWKGWRQYLSAWEDYSAEPQEFIEIGDQVLVIARNRGRGKSSGVEVDQLGAAVLTLREGKITRLVLYWDTDEARRSLGLA